MVALGIGSSLVGQRLRQQYFREFDPLRADQDPVYAMNSSLRTRGIAVLLYFAAQAF
jgi:hypothetical protein